MKTVLVFKRTKIGERTFFGGRHEVDDETSEALVEAGAEVVTSGSAPDGKPAPAKNHFGRASVTGKTPDKPAKESK